MGCHNNSKQKRIRDDAARLFEAFRNPRPHEVNKVVPGAYLPSDVQQPTTVAGHCLQNLPEVRTSLHLPGAAR